MSLRHILYIPFVLILAGGCVRDDRSNCITPTPVLTESVVMDLSHTKNESDTEQIDDLTNIRIYVFDQATNRLFTVIEAGVADIGRRFVERALPRGTYTMIAWASSMRNLAASGFVDATATGNNTDLYTVPAQVGVTTLDQFRLMLAYNPPDAEGYLTPRVMPLDNLYYDELVNVQVLNLDDQTVTFDFGRNFATFDVEIRGLQYLPAGEQTAFRAYITARNGVYTHDNVIDNNSRTVKYDPYENTLTGGMRSIKIKTLRLDLRRVDDFPLVLYIKRPATPPATGEVDLPGSPINLTRLVMGIQENGVYTYLQQDPIDRKSSFAVEVNIMPNTAGGLIVQISLEGVVIEQIIPQT
jgi:hypothetical protein